MSASQDRALTASSSSTQRICRQRAYRHARKKFPASFDRLRTSCGGFRVFGRDQVRFSVRRRQKQRLRSSAHMTSGRCQRSSKTGFPMCGQVGCTCGFRPRSRILCRGRTRLASLGRIPRSLGICSPCQSLEWWDKIKGTSVRKGVIGQENRSQIR